MQRFLGKQATMERTRYPSCKVLPIGRKGDEESVEIIGELVIEEHYKLGVSVFSPFDMYLSSMASIMFCTEMKVLGPVDNPSPQHILGLETLKGC